MKNMQKIYFTPFVLMIVINTAVAADSTNVKPISDLVPQTQEIVIGPLASYSTDEWDTYKSCSDLFDSSSSSYCKEDVARCPDYCISKRVIKPPFKEGDRAIALNYLSPPNCPKGYSFIQQYAPGIAYAYSGRAYVSEFLDNTVSQGGHCTKRNVFYDSNAYNLFIQVGEHPFRFYPNYTVNAEGREVPAACKYGQFILANFWERERSGDDQLDRDYAAGNTAGSAYTKYLCARIKTVWTKP